MFGLYTWEDCSFLKGYGGEVDLVEKRGGRNGLGGVRERKLLPEYKVREIKKKSRLCLFLHICFLTIINGFKTEQI